MPQEDSVNVHWFVLNRDLEGRGVFGDAPSAIAGVDEEGVLRLIDDDPGASNPCWVGAGCDGDGTSDPLIAEDGVVIHSPSVYVFPSGEGYRAFIGLRR